MGHNSHIPGRNGHESINCADPTKIQAKSTNVTADVTPDVTANVTSGIQPLKAGGPQPRQTRDPCDLGQRTLPQGAGCQAVPVTTGVSHSPDPASTILPASQPDRAVMGGHAPARDAQPSLPHTETVRRCHPRIPARNHSK